MSMKKDLIKHNTDLWHLDGMFSVGWEGRAQETLVSGCLRNGNCCKLKCVLFINREPLVCRTMRGSTEGQLFGQLAAFAWSLAGGRQQSGYHFSGGGRQNIQSRAAVD